MRFGRLLLLLLLLFLFPAAELTDAGDVEGGGEGDLLDLFDAVFSFSSRLLFVAAL
jgi:hypothetical protein